MFWSGLIHLTASQDLSVVGGHGHLEQPIPVSVLLLDLCDAVRDQDCVIVFENDVEVAVPGRDAWTMDVPQGKMPEYEEIAPVRPLARNPLVVPVAAAEVETLDP